MFSSGDKLLRVKDFSDAADVLDLSDFDFAAVREVKALAVQRGDKTVINMDGDRIVLLNFDRDDLDGGDFIL